METEFTIEDTEGDTISFRISDGTDLVEITIPINKATMSADEACVVLDKQDIARLVEKLDLPEVYYE